MTKDCKCQFCIVYRRVKDNPYPEESDLSILTWLEIFEEDDILKEYWTNVFIPIKYTKNLYLNMKKKENEITQWLHENSKSNIDISWYEISRTKGLMVRFFYERGSNIQAKQDAMLFKLRWI